MLVFEAAQIAQVGPERIRILIAEGVIRARRMGNGFWDVDKSSLERWMDERRTKRGDKPPRK